MHHVPYIANAPGSGMYFWAEALLLLLAALVFKTLYTVRGFDEPRRLPFLDLLSYFLSGASVLFFVWATVERETQAWEDSVASKGLIEPGDPYDPSRILPLIRSTILQDCPETPECIDLLAQMNRNTVRGNHFPFVFDIPDNIPSELKELILKENIGVELLAKPAFFDRPRSLAYFVGMLALLLGLTLGLWRRWIIFVRSKKM